MKRQTVNEWLKNNVQVGAIDDCWNVNAKSRNKAGWHVRFKAEGKSRLAHREAWIEKNGEIADGLCVLHKCDNPTCCNPLHLFLGTRAENVADMINKGRGGMGKNNRKGKTGIPSPLKMSIDINKAVDMYLKGMTQREVAKIIGCSDVTLGKHLATDVRVKHLLGRGVKKKLGVSVKDDVSVTREVYKRLTFQKVA